MSWPIGLLTMALSLTGHYATHCVGFTALWCDVTYSQTQIHESIGECPDICYVGIVGSFNLDRPLVLKYNTWLEGGPKHKPIYTTWVYGAPPWLPFIPGTEPKLPIPKELR